MKSYEFCWRKVQILGCVGSESYHFTSVQEMGVHLIIYVSFTLFVYFSKAPFLIEYNLYPGHLDYVLIQGVNVQNALRLQYSRICQACIVIGIIAGSHV